MNTQLFTLQGNQAIWCKKNKKKTNLYPKSFLPNVEQSIYSEFANHLSYCGNFKHFFSKKTI